MISPLVTIALLTLAGTPALFRARRFGIAGAAGIAFLLGCGTVAFSLLLLEVTGVAWNRTASLIATGVVALMVAAIIPKSRRSSDETKGSWLLAVPFDAATAVFVAGHAVWSTLAPAWQWDFWMIWGVKARAFAEEGGIDWPLLQDPLQNEAIQPTYPLLLPLVLDFDALVRGTWDDRGAGALFTAFAAAAVLVMRELLAVELRSYWRAAAGTLALAGTLLSGWIGTAEIPLIAFTSCGLLLMRDALRRDDEKSLVIPALFLGSAAATKLEGVTFLIAVAAALLITHRFRATIRMAPAFALAGIWPLILLAHPVEKLYFAQGGGAERLVARLAEAPSLVAQLAMSIQRPLFVAILLMTVLFHRRSAMAREGVVLAALGLQLICFVGAYLVTPYDPEWHIANSWPRLSHQLIPPLAFLAVALLLGERDDAEVPSA